MSNAVGLRRQPVPTENYPNAWSAKPSEEEWILQNLNLCAFMLHDMLPL